MNGERSEQALARIEAALGRIEAAIGRAESALASEVRRNEHLRRAIGDTLRELDQLIGKGESA